MNLQFMYKMVTEIRSNGLVPFLCSLNWGGRHLAWLKSPRKLQSSQTVVHSHLYMYNEPHGEKCNINHSHFSSHKIRHQTYTGCIQNAWKNLKSKFILKDQQPAHTNTDKMISTDFYVSEVNGQLRRALPLH
jgi:hypothetical protein